MTNLKIQVLTAFCGNMGVTSGNHVQWFSVTGVAAARHREEESWRIRSRTLRFSYLFGKTS